MNTPGLGRCLAVYKMSAGGWVKLALMLIASLAVGGTVIAAGIEETNESLGPRIFLCFLGLLFSAPGLICVYGFIFGRKNAVRFHEAGLAIHKLGRETSIRWEEIATYSEGMLLTIETTAGNRIDFGGGLANQAEVLRRLNEELTIRRAVPRLLAAIREGQTVGYEGEVAPLGGEEPFDESYVVGGFFLDANGLAPPGAEQPIPWREITDCRVIQRWASGRLPLTISWVVVKSTRGNFRSAIEPTSSREELTALCRELALK